MPNYAKEPIVEGTCACGCGTPLVQMYNNYKIKYIKEHRGRGQPRDYCKKPDSNKKFTGYWRAKNVIPIRNKCSFDFTFQCKGPIQIHHVDKNPMNNDISNLLVVCNSHHRMIHNKRITIENPYMPEFYTDKSGKRRYKKQK